MSTTIDSLNKVLTNVQNNREQIVKQIAASTKTLPTDPAVLEQLIQLLHTALIDTHVEEGSLVCPKCSRVYPIQQGIPNLRLNENEV